MSTVIATEDLEAVLRGLTERAEIRTPEGKLLGYFTPTANNANRLYELAKTLFDPEEMKRRAASEPTGYSIEQVQAHLKSLESKP